jgi:formyl-CoA transferase
VCKLLDLEDLSHHPDYVDNSARATNRETLRARMNERLVKRSAIEWTKAFVDAGIPAGPVYTLDQVFADPQVRHCGLVEEARHPIIGALKQLSNPLRMENVGGNTVRSHPPLLGEHSEDVLKTFGLSNEEISSLIASGVVMIAKQEA